MLLSRSQSSDYIRLEGQQKLTNVTAHDWDLYILKELVDNALDANEMVQHENGSPHIRVIMEYDRKANGLRDNSCEPCIVPTRIYWGFVRLIKTYFG